MTRSRPLLRSAPRAMPARSLLALLALCLLACASPGFAIGVSPATRTLHAGDAFSFTALLDDAQFATVRVEGDLAAFVRLDATEIDADGRISGEILALPDIAPGDHAQLIVISPRGVASEGTVGAVAEVAARLVIRVPYDGQYLRGSWSASPAGDATLLAVTLENVGNAGVVPASVILRVEGTGERDEEPAREFPFSPHEILPDAFVRLERTESLAPGVRTGTLEVIDVARSFTDVHEFIVGAPDIMELRAQLLREPGEITPLDVAGTVHWNRPVEVTVVVLANGTWIAEQRSNLSGAFSERLYLETALLEAPLAVRLAWAGGERTLAISDAPQPGGDARRMRWAFASCVILAIACIAYVRRTRT